MKCVVTRYSKSLYVFSCHVSIGFCFEAGDKIELLTKMYSVIFGEFKLGVKE